MSWGDKWTGESRAKGEFKTIDQGKYEATITDGSFDKEKNTATFEFTITGPAYENRKVWSNYKEDKEEFLMNDLFNLGHKEKITASTLESVLKAQIGKDVVIFVKPREHNGKTYYGVYVNELLDNTFPKPPSMDQENIGF